MFFNFDSWVRDLKNKKLPEITTQAIFSCIKNSLEPLECLWVNYYQLLKFEVNRRTISIGEALHWATKGSFDKVKSSMTPVHSANMQMTQAEREQHDVKDFNEFTNLW